MFPILKHYDLFKYFDFCGGSDEAETHADKTTVIRYVMDGCGAKADDVVMVGDRHHDIDGAKANGVTSVGILYGYGDRAELEAAGADYIVPAVANLRALILTAPR